MKKTNATGRSVGSDKNTAAPAAQAPAVTTESTTTEGGEGDSTDSTDGDKPAEIVDPFANLPVVHAANYEVRDLTQVTEVAAARKYAGVAAKANEAHSQMKLNWKYADAVFKIGSNRHEKRAGSVMRQVQDIVSGYGAEGCPAIVLVSRLRQAAVNNSRSHFCQGKLPPVGWAEGYVDGAVNDKLIMKSSTMKHDLLPKVAEQPEEQTTPASQAA